MCGSGGSYDCYIRTKEEHKMKKIIITIIAVTLSVAASAQIPYFAGTVGNGKLYGYTSLKARPGINAQETYTTFQYGTSAHTAALV